MIRKSVNIPNELIKKAMLGENGLTDHSLAIYCLMKTKFKNCTVYGKSAKEFANKLGINVNTAKKHIPILERNGLIRVDNKNIVSVSTYKIAKQYKTKRVYNFVRFDGCETLNDYSSRLKLSLIHRKITDINYATQCLEEPSKYYKNRNVYVNKDSENIHYNVDVLFDLGVVNRNINRCIGYRSLSKVINRSQMSIKRLLSKEKLNNNVSVQEVYYHHQDVKMVEIDHFKTVEELNSKKPIRFCWIGLDKTQQMLKCHFGSLIEVKCVDNFTVRNKHKFFRSLNKKKKFFSSIYI